MSTRANYVKARYSMNDGDRETANIRDYCNNKFSFFRLKKIFIAAILPLLLIVLFASLGVSSGTVYAGLGIWMLVGFGYAVYLNYKFAYVGWKINNSKPGELSVDNCGF
jgi:hypothetical protein